MSEPEIKFEIDEYGRIVCRVTNEGVLLSKEEKERIISDILRMQEENARLRELVLARFACDSDACESCADCQLSGSKPFRCVEVARELCVEVD